MVNKKDSNLGILITILIIFVGFLLGLIKIVIYIIKKQTELIDYNYAWIMLIILFFSYFLLKFCFIIGKAIYYETSFLNDSKINSILLNNKVKESYLSVMGGWFLHLSSIIPAFVAVVYIQIFDLWWGYLIAFFVTLVVYLFIGLIIINPLLKDEHKIKKPKDIWILFRNSFNIQNILGNIKFVFSNLFLLFIYLALITTFTSTVDISLEKSMYYPDEDVRFEVSPKGFLVPKIIVVKYSNDHILYNGSNEKFGASRRYLTINHSLLTTDPPYSFLQIYYSPTNIGWLGKHRVLKMVPVFERVNKTN